MRQAFLFAVSSLAPGGAERVIAEIANALVETDSRIGVLTISEAGGDHYPLNPKVRRIALDLMWNSTGLWNSLSNNLKRSRILRWAIRDFAPDIVVSFIDQTNVRVLLATIGMGIPILVSERIDPRRHRIGRAWEVARRLLYPRARCVVVQTEAVAPWARSVVLASRVRVIPNFVRSLPLPNEQRDPNLLLAVGRLDPQKGFDILIAAFAASRAAEQGARLVILGEGPERRRLQEMASELGVGKHVDMPGVVPNPEVWMARAPIFVLSSRYEGFPNALLEAMAMGCAVIAADCDCGPREIVRDGVDGILVPTESADALLNAIVRLRQDKPLRERLGAEALRVRSRFDKSTIVARWRTLLQDLMR
jgi:GalNAc-alpha-(1->4)-GalNAc-alpha-(1->3)-diNAcBac-PP-undecaprenol alpha-1,4-N-acetyl-D-galactosaminyltransferase